MTRPESSCASAGGAGRPRVAAWRVAAASPYRGIRQARACGQAPHARAAVRRFSAKRCVPRRCRRGWRSGCSWGRRIPRPGRRGLPGQARRQGRCWEPCPSIPRTCRRRSPSKAAVAHRDLESGFGDLQRVGLVVDLDPLRVQVRQGELPHPSRLPAVQGALAARVHDGHLLALGQEEGRDVHRLQVAADDDDVVLYVVHVERIHPHDVDRLAFRKPAFPLAACGDHHDVGRLALHEVGIDLLVRDGLHAGELKLAFKVASQIPQPLVGALVGFGGRQQASKRPLLLVQGDVVTAQRRYAGGLHAGRAPSDDHDVPACLGRTSP